MAPITDDMVGTLRDTIHKLESRVQQLEAKLLDPGSSSQSASSRTDSVRMILMGPPGAGMCMEDNSGTVLVLMILPGKGTQAPKIKEKYCACHLVRFEPLPRHSAFYPS